MKVWTDKAGNKLTAGEFMSRWKEGIQKVTPVQQAKSQIFGYFIMFAGIIWGLAITFNIKQWWLFTILCGSIVITGVQFLGTYQKYLLLARYEKEVLLNVTKKDL